MADENAEQKVEGEEAAKTKSKLVPVLLGVVLVVGAAVGVVAVTSPASKGAPAKVDISELPAQKWEDSLEWTANLDNRRILKLVLVFEYKAEADPELIPRMEDNLARAHHNILLLLYGKSSVDLRGAKALIELKRECQMILTEDLFPDGKGEVSDVFIKEFLVQ